MDKNIPNKAMKPETIKTKSEYFFPGGMEFEPATVEAESIEEATEIYEKIKKPINK